MVFLIHVLFNGILNSCFIDSRKLVRVFCVGLKRMSNLLRVCKPFLKFGHKYWPYQSSDGLRILYVFQRTVNLKSYLTKTKLTCLSNHNHLVKQFVPNCFHIRTNASYIKYWPSVNHFNRGYIQNKVNYK